LNYDEDADVLYVTFVPDQPAVALEIREGIIARIDPTNRQLLGVTVIGFSEHQDELADITGIRVSGVLTVDDEDAIIETAL